MEQARCGELNQDTKAVSLDNGKEVTLKAGTLYTLLKRRHKAGPLATLHTYLGKDQSAVACGPDMYLVPSESLES